MVRSTDLSRDGQAVSETRCVLAATMTISEKLHHIENALHKVRDASGRISEEYLTTHVDLNKAETECIVAALEIAAGIVELMKGRMA